MTHRWTRFFMLCSQLDTILFLLFSTGIKQVFAMFGYNTYPLRRTLYANYIVNYSRMVHYRIVMRYQCAAHQITQS